jgi:hypothetical protein
MRFVHCSILIILLLPLGQKLLGLVQIFSQKMTAAETATFAMARARNAIVLIIHTEAALSCSLRFLDLITVYLFLK